MCAAPLLIASVLVTALASPVLALTPITVCVTCRVARTPHSLHAEFAARHYAHEYPNLNVTTRFIGQYEAGGTTQRGLIRAFVAQGDNCDLVVGPGSSSIAVAMNPLVESAWVDYSATATELSSRFDFPLFNRVVPTDADATRGYAPLLSAANWRNLDLICSDSAYGRSVAAGMGDVAEGLGGHLRQSTCLSVAADERAVAAELQAVLARGYRVVFVAMGSSDPAFASLIAAAQTSRATDRLIFLFSEAACSSAVQPWAALPGAFCTTFALSESVRAPFLAAYERRDTAAASAEYQRMGWPASDVNLHGTGVFPAFAADATRFALRALASAAANNSGRALPALSERAAALRRYTMLDGVTGAIAIPRGDRSAADMVLINSRPGGAHLTVANITANGQMTVDPSLFVLGAQTLIADLPPSSDADRAATSTVYTSTGTPVALIVVVAIAAALLLTGGGAFATVRLRQRNGGRDNRFAPTDARKPFAVVFTDIQSSTALWATNPEAFGLAVDTHHAVLRAAVARHNGYEVKTIGDAFMLAFENVNDAVACALDVQSELFTSKWPAFIDEVYKIQAEDSAAPCAELEDEDYAKLWSGVRVRIGVHFGTGDIKVDPVSQGYDYYGTVVNTAARVEGVAHGGQIVVTGAAFEAAQEAISAAKASVTVLGAQLLRGLPNAVELFQLVPAEIARREFPPLRLQVEHVVVEDDVAFDDRTTTVGGADNRSSCDDPNAILPEGADRPAALVAIEGDATIPRCSRSSSAASLNAAATIGGGNGGGGITRTSQTARERAVLDKRTPEYVCFRASKQNDGATYEGMLFQFNVLKAVVSTLPEGERRSIVRTLAERWRIGEARALRGDGNRKSKANSLATDRVLALLAARAAPVAARYTTVQLTSESPSSSEGLVFARQRSMTSAPGAELARSVGPLSRSSRSNGDPLHSPQNAERSQPSSPAAEASE